MLEALLLAFIDVPKAHLSEKIMHRCTADTLQASSYLTSCYAICHMASIIISRQKLIVITASKVSYQVRWVGSNSQVEKFRNHRK